MVDVVEPDDTVRRLGLAHVDGEATLRALAPYAQVERHLGLFSAVFEKGEPLFAPEVRGEMLAVGMGDPEHLRLRRALGARSAITVPVTSSGAVLGALGARMGGAPTGKAVARVVVLGVAAMLLTIGLGRLLGTSI